MNKMFTAVAIAQLVEQGKLRLEDTLANFVEAENSMGFHVDQEAVRILGNSINFSRLGQAALRGDRVPEAPLEAAAASAHRSKQCHPERSEGDHARTWPPSLRSG